MRRLFRRLLEPTMRDEVCTACDYLGADIGAMETFRNDLEKFNEFAKLAYDHIRDIRIATGTSPCMHNH